MKLSRIKDLLIAILLVLLAAGISHFVITNPLGPSRILYYGEAFIIQWETRCEEGAPEWMPQVQRYATRNMGAPASQLAVVMPGGEQHHCETGWKDGFWGQEPLSHNARFRFASTTKTVTAIAVLNLINQGYLALDDKIVEVLELEGELNDPRVGDITIAHLLSHRAGWDRTRTQDVMFMMNTTPWCPYEPKELTGTGLMYAPGEKEAYSNLGYCLLGLAIEKVTGQPFREHMSSAFGFGSTTLQFVDGPYQPDEPVYDFRHENFYMSSYIEDFDFQAISSSAGLSGSALDLAKLVSSSLESGPLTILDGNMNSDCNPASVQECYGYGLYRYQPTEQVAPLYIHGGKLPGASSAIIVTPDRQVIVWVGAGVPRSGSNALQEFYDFIRDKAGVVRH